MRYWYIARNDELMVDIDCKPGQPPAKLLLSRSRLMGGMGAGLLNVKQWGIFYSETVNHYHVIVQLASDLPIVERCAWESRLLDDPYRRDMNLARALYGVTGSLLITPQRHKGFYREPDYVCSCRAKHTAEVMGLCPVAERVRGAAKIADYYGLPMRDKRPIIFGAQPLELPPQDTDEG